MLFWLTSALILESVLVQSQSWQERCKGNWVPPPNVVNTTLRLAALRQQLSENNISAYIIPSGDAHQSEYKAEHDNRRGFISGFTGSAGDAVVTKENAALWTDSRYYIQAADQLDCNWQLMPSGEPGTPSIQEWLGQVLHMGATVSGDAKISSFQQWESWRTSLEKKNIVLAATSDNLVDLVWGLDQPSYPNVSLYVLETKYAGRTWQEKINSIRKSLSNVGADTLILSALDEIAWTVNLRGGDIPFTPVFRSYLVIQSDKATLYIPDDKITNTIQNHLNSLGMNQNASVQLKSYEDIWSDLDQIGKESKKIALPTNYSYAQGVSYLLHLMLPAEKIIDVVSPALIQKDTKNEVEAAGMVSAHIKDGVALSVFLARITDEIMAGNKNNWTELTVVSKLDELRWKQMGSKGPSFGTIAAVGKNAALPHYEPSNQTNLQVTSTELLLIDSGGQYLDGTTDVTRTVHFGTPRNEEILVYTKLLMGCIDIVTTIFPEKETLNSLEILLRRPLYSLGMNYGHGSTHGIGSLLNVHEAFNTTYHVNFFGSQEPGFYKENDFGIRLENIVHVIRAHPMSGDENYLTFTTVTLVPYERKLIDVTIMEKRHSYLSEKSFVEVGRAVNDYFGEQKEEFFYKGIAALSDNGKKRVALKADNFEKQCVSKKLISYTLGKIQWLDEYHDRVKELVGSEMIKQGYAAEYQWLIEKTLPIKQKL